MLLQDPALDAPGRQRLAPPREDHRTVLLAARDGAQLDGLVAVGRCLATLGRHELLLTQAVESEASLAGAVAATRAHRDELATAGVTARAAAFVSRAFGPDMARLALTHDADLTVADRLGEIAADGSIPEDLALLLERSPCDVALLAGAAPLPFADGIAVVFAGGEHDWAAAELGAWLAAGASARLQLVGVRGRDGSDASRLLASASIAIQQVVGVDVEPVLADAGPDASSLPPDRPAWSSWGSRRAGVATASASRAARSWQPPPPTILVHRGARPGGLAPREQLTRFTWTIAAGG